METHIHKFETLRKISGSLKLKCLICGRITYIKLPKKEKE